MTSLSSDQLDAFEAVARLGNFSAAAKELHITQPALSRRVQALESALGLNLFLRATTGAELTPEGYRLLNYVKARQALESELRADLGRDARAEGLGGMIRIAGYSSLLNQFVAPALAPLLRENPRIQISFIASQGVRPPQRQVGMVQRAEVDFLVSTEKAASRELESQLLGLQELVAIESSKYSQRKNTFVDSRAEDLTTETFFSRNPSFRRDYERSFLHDEEGIVNGVTLGLGRAVVFSTMLRPGLPVRRIPGWKSLRWKLYLTSRRQSHPPKLLQVANQVLMEAIPKILGHG
jgi:DNA-binding transcriptional LysR family regulator